MPADAGIRFGQYVLVRRIARGGMAEVFLAQQRGLEGFDRRVAVKRILPHLADSPDFVKMFLGEARLAAQLSHPNVVHIYEFGKVDHDYFIAMEYVDGVHAGQLFKQNDDKLSPTLIARIGADAANALHYAHELRAPTGKLYGLVHRDVSPANIMVSYDGVVKLCDFGIAKAAAAGDQLTNPGQVKGKYAYMSPEQTIAAPLDGRSDVFSLAIVLYELLAGKYIVPRGDAVAAMRMIRDGKIEPLDKIAPHVPPPLVKAIKWALEPKRENRATAADFAQALESFIKSSPELATSMQLATWVRSHFTREVTDEHKAVSPGTHAGPGTLASPGTAAAPGTAAVPATAASAASIAVTPPVYPPRRFVKLVNDNTAEGTEIYSASDLEEESAETIKGPRKPPDFSQMARESSGDLAEDTIDLPSRRKALSKMPADKATVVVTPDAEETVAAAPPIVGGRKAPDEEDSENHLFETIERDNRTPVPSGPTVVPTRMQPAAAPFDNPLAPKLDNPLAAHHDNPFLAQIGSSPPAGIPALAARPSIGPASRKKRQKLLVMVAGLSGLALLSFMIALAASSGPAPVKRQDAGVAVTPIPIDSQIVVTPLPTIDAAPAATVPVDAGGDAYLEVRTIPDGGTIKVGEQTRETDKDHRAQLVLPAGRHSITAELAGYSSEKRDVVLEPGEHQKIEIAFTKKLPKQVDRGQPMGRLTVRTTPWSDVYLGGKKLGQAPFADLELPAGTHTLTFKNPSRPQVTKTVKINAGKSTKLNFNLP